MIIENQNEAAQIILGCFFYCQSYCYFCLMLTEKQQDMIKGDFEKYFKDLKSKRMTLDFELFGDYAASILNFYIGSSLLNIHEKEDGALFLIRLFNAGLGNVISAADQQEIAKVIQQDPTLNYAIIQPVFDL